MKEKNFKDINKLKGLRVTTSKLTSLKVRSLAKTLLKSVITTPLVVSYASVVGIITFATTELYAAEKAPKLSDEQLRSYPIPLRNILSDAVDANIKVASGTFTDSSYLVGGKYWAVSDKYKQSIEVEKDLLTQAKMCSQQEYRNFISAFSQEIRNAYERDDVEKIFCLINGFTIYKAVYEAKNSEKFFFLEKSLDQNEHNELFSIVMSELKKDLIKICLNKSSKEESCWQYLCSQIGKISNNKMSLEECIKHDYDCYLKQFNVILGSATSVEECLLENSVFEETLNDIKDGLELKNVLGDDEFKKFVQNAGITGKQMNDFLLYLTFPSPSGLNFGCICYDIKGDGGERGIIPDKEFINIFKEICNKFVRSALQPAGGDENLASHKLNVNEYAEFLKHVILQIYDEKYMPTAQFSFGSINVPAGETLPSIDALASNESLVDSITMQVRKKYKVDKKISPNIIKQKPNVTNEKSKSSTDSKKSSSSNKDKTSKRFKPKNLPYNHDFITPKEKYCDPNSSEEALINGTYWAYILSNYLSNLKQAGAFRNQEQYDKMQDLINYAHRMDVSAKYINGCSSRNWLYDAVLAFFKAQAAKIDEEIAKRGGIGKVTAPELSKIRANYGIGGDNFFYILQEPITPIIPITQIIVDVCLSATNKEFNRQSCLNDSELKLLVNFVKNYYEDKVLNKR